MYALLACWWTVFVPVSLLLLLLLPSLLFPLLSPPWVVGASAFLALLFLQATTLYGTLVRIGRVGACPSSTYHDTVVVGGGWSWYLQGRRASGARVYTTRHLRGRLSTSDDGEWWGAGSTIAEVQRSLARRGLSLSGHPSILTATLGGWMASRSHGSGGTLWTPSTRRLRVYDREEGRVKVVAGKQDLVFSSASRYVVLAVEVLPVANVSCRRVAFDLRTESEARRYLTQPSYVRVLFVHAGGGTCFLWQDEEAEADSPSVVARVAARLYPPWLWTLLPCGCFPRAWWTARTTLRDAHAFAPTPPLVSTAFASTLFLNFELFVKLSSSSPPLTSSLLLTLCQRLREEVCRPHGGRCEVRGGGSARRGGTLFVDVVLPTRSATEGSRAVLRVVHDLLGGAVTLFHPGKGRPKGEEEGVSNDWRGGTVA